MPALIAALRRADVIAIAYETVQRPDGSLPLLTPMSEVAGRLAVLEGAHHLGKAHGGRGILLSGVPGVPPGNVVILGAGTVGQNAMRIAIGLGADVTLLDVNLDRLRHVDEHVPRAGRDTGVEHATTSARPRSAPISSWAPSSSRARGPRS